MGMTGKELHDLLLANKPQEAHHDAESCPHCDPQGEPSQEATMADAIFTVEQHEKLLAAAVDEARAAATAAVDAEVLKLNETLAKAESDLAAKDAEIMDLRSKIEAAAEQERLSALETDRVKVVASVANFTDEQIEARKARWAKMSEDEFAAMLDDYRAIASEVPATTRTTSFDQTRATAKATTAADADSLEKFFSYGLDVAGKL
jgi:hypothetical protein